MQSLYQGDLAYIHAKAFGSLARGAAPEIVRVLRGAAVPIRHVVEVGCGAGTLTAELVAAGFEVTGFDPSAEMLAIARAAVPAARFVHASVYDLPIPDCQAVVALGEPLSYHRPEADAENLLRRFFQHLATVLPIGGLLIFDVIEPGEPSLDGRSWLSGEDWAVLVQTKEDQRKRIVVRDIESFRCIGDLYRRQKQLHTLKLFDGDRLCELLESCRFALRTETCYGSQRLPPRRRAYFATLVASAGGVWSHRHQEGW
jgi:SAM-dependent methyltransferase